MGKTEKGGGGCLVLFPLPVGASDGQEGRRNGRREGRGEEEILEDGGLPFFPSRIAAGSQVREGGREEIGIVGPPSRYVYWHRGSRMWLDCGCVPPLLYPFSSPIPSTFSLSLLAHRATPKLVNDREYILCC